MTYTRVIPRDLFNEGDLLNCLGRLWIALDERRDHAARLRHRHEAGPFNIDQDPSDGSISCENVLLKVGAEHVHLFRPLNARTKWPLWARFDIEDVRVFDEAGDLSTEFWVLISQPGLVAQRRARQAEDDDGYPPPCTDPAGHDFPPVEENERSLCANCGADGDA